MNILHHKSWHVRNKDNIERVRRDEQKAADEEKEKKRKIALAESEARTDFLRKNAKARDAIDDGGTTNDGIAIDRVDSGDKQLVVKSTNDPLTNINLFHELENGNKQTVKNIEYEKEKQKEKEDAEKKLGILTYLGQSSIESQTNKPWYLKQTTKNDEEERVLEESRKKDDQKKSLLDPLKQISKFLENKNKTGKESKDKKHKKKSKKHEKKRKRKSKSIEEMREERMKREGNERIRTQELLDSRNAPKSSEVEEPVEDERSRGYNSAFNPELSRKRHYQH